MGLAWLGHRAAACLIPPPPLYPLSCGWKIHVAHKENICSAAVFTGICYVNLNSLLGMTKGPFSGSASSCGELPRCRPLSPASLWASDSQGPLASLGTVQLLPSPEGQSALVHSPLS